MDNYEISDRACPKCSHEYRQNHQESIKCPSCGSIELATVEYTKPFNTYIHNCSKCKYVIMESEWEQYKPNPIACFNGGKSCN
jgi:RNA polymerase subunit RPABC4/transcription elongation factor Spt4